MKITDLKYENGICICGNVPLSDGVYLSVRFSGVRGCSRIDVAADDPSNVILSMSVIGYHGFSEKDAAHVQISGLSGTHTLYLKPRPGLTILSVELSEENPVPEYIPVPDEAITDMQSSSWTATDELGRKIADAEDVRGYRSDRKVGIFYWSWRDAHSALEPVNVTKIMRETPGAEYNENHPAWGENRATQAFWNEPLYGYYLNRDPYVIRRHAVLLANAGVDMIMFDCTNGSLVWKESYEPILEGFRAAHADGINAPKFAFMLNFAPFGTSEDMLRALYQDIYSAGKYRDLWYLHEGKPLIMAYPECLPEKGSCDRDTALLNEIRNFFTFRPGQPSYGFGPTETRMWGWLEKYPQHKFGCRPDGTCEMMTVGVAQNCNDELICTYFNNRGTYGRSYTHKFGHKLLDETSYKYGWNVQEQWDRAIDCDPDFIFVTGWNEWIMGRWHEPWVKDPDSTQLAFVDQFDLEHSRDIEPDRDGIRDTYYLQLCSNIRRYKGALPRQMPSSPKTIRTAEDFADVQPTYRSERGTTIHRDCRGFGSTHYKNTTGRNNIISAKAARDGDFVYFMAECAGDITEKQGENHMTLYINLTGDRSTGWEGYDIAVSRGASTEGRIPVEKYGASGFEAVMYISCIQSGRTILYRLPRSLFGDGPLDFQFKWADNVGTDDIIDFYCDGDTAPAGRFNYIYRETGFPVKDTTDRPAACGSK